MSFGFSVSEFVEAGQLAYKLYAACRDAPQEYNELAGLCRDVGIAVNACSPNDPRSVLKEQHKDAIALVGSNCLSTLKRLEDLLTKYQSSSGTIQNFGKKLGFVSAKSERESIRSRLQEHLAAISAVLNGVQINTLGFTVTLLVTMMKSEGQGLKAVDLQKMIDDPAKLQDLFQDLCQESKIAKDQLDQNKTAIEEKLKKAIQDDGKTSISSTPASGISNTRRPRGPATASTVPYDPNAIDWYATGGKNFMLALNLFNAKSLTVKPADPIIRYSKEDEHWCKLPEGWSITQTLLRRGGRNSELEEAYYYSFNNLSCAPDNASRTSRAYFYTNPFESRMSGTFAAMASSPTSRFIAYYAPPPQPNGLPNMPIGYDSPGFLLNGLPIDLGDSLSREYAMMTTIGNNGHPAQYSNDTISAGFPAHWTWDPDDSGKGHHIYINGKTGTWSTVHPSRFYDETTDTSEDLPPNWDRRLDSWGNLFFVDKMTRIAVREDPRFNAKIDQATGLPKGWFATNDHQKPPKPFFYTTIGNMNLGTHEAAWMNDRSVKGKMNLSAVPQEGQDPHTLALRTRPRDRQREAARMEQEKSKIRDATDEEIKHYYNLFEAMPKQTPHFVLLAEAIEQCKSFLVPTALVFKILSEADSDHDYKWDCDEYVKALHMIRVELEKTYQNNPITIPTKEQKKYYYSLFETAKKVQLYRMRLNEVIEYCKNLSLPDDLIKATWLGVDANHDEFYSPNEFANGMHQLVSEVVRRNALRMDVPLKIVQNAPSAGEVTTALTAEDENQRTASTETKKLQPFTAEDISSQVASLSIAGTEVVPTEAPQNSASSTKVEGDNPAEAS